MSYKYSLRHIAIITKLQNAPASFEQINQAIETETGDKGVSKRTFQRDIQEIETNFGIKIVFDKKSNTYKIVEYPDSTIDETRLDIVLKLFIRNNISLQGKYIDLESRQVKGSGQILTLLKAIRESEAITFLYQKYWEDDVKIRTGNPLGIKEYQNFWYLIMQDNDDDNKIKTFGIDRISGIKKINKKFQYPKNFNLQDYFKHSFGLYTSEGEPEEVILSFDKIQGGYIKAAPLHHSQEILIDNEKEVRIKLKIHIQYDFIKELLSRHELVKVIKPKHLIDELKEKYKKALALYE